MRRRDLSARNLPNTTGRSAFIFQGAITFIILTNGRMFQIFHERENIFVRALNLNSAIETHAKAAKTGVINGLWRIRDFHSVDEGSETCFSPFLRALGALGEANGGFQDESLFHAYPVG